MNEPLAVREAPASYVLDAQRIRPGYKQTEVGVIPEDWEAVQFGEIAMPRRQRIDPKKSGIQEFCVELEHIASGTGFLLGSTNTSDQSSLKSVFRADDILFGKLRAYLRKYWQADRTGVCSTEIWILSPIDKLFSSAYLFQVVQTDKFIEAASLSYGTHMPRSDWNVVKNYPIPLPPTKAEQEAIAEALSDADALIESLAQLVAKKRHLKQGAMQELLTGKKRLPGFSGEWEVKRLDDICQMKSGEGITSAAIDDYSKFPCYGGNGLRGYTTRYTHDGSYALIGRQGALCGNVVGVDGKIFASEHAIVVTPLKETDIHWLALVLARMNLNQYSESSAQPGLSVSKLLSIPWQAPPLNEQTAIAAILNDIDAELTALETKLTKARNIKQGMMQELLTGRIRLV